MRRSVSPVFYGVHVYLETLRAGVRRELMVDIFCAREASYGKGDASRRIGGMPHMEKGTLGPGWGGGLQVVLRGIRGGGGQV